MNLQAKKYKLIEWITNIHDDAMLNKLLEIAEDSDWWDNISDAERASIDRGLKDLKEGRYYDHSEAKKLYEKYL